jgi:hypothetical protein
MIAVVLVVYGPGTIGEFRRLNCDGVSVVWPVNVMTTFPPAIAKFVIKGDWPGGGPEPPTRCIRKYCIPPLFGSVA